MTIMITAENHMVDQVDTRIKGTMINSSGVITETTSSKNNTTNFNSTSSSLSMIEGNPKTMAKVLQTTTVSKTTFPLASLTTIHHSRTSHRREITIMGRPEIVTLEPEADSGATQVAQEEIRMITGRVIILRTRTTSSSRERCQLTERATSRGRTEARIRTTRRMLAALPKARRKISTTYSELTSLTSQSRSRNL